MKARPAAACLLLLLCAAAAATESGDIEIAVSVVKSQRPIAGARLGWSVGNIKPGSECRSLDEREPVTDALGRGKIRLRCRLDASGWYAINEVPWFVTVAVLGEGNVTLAHESFPTRTLGISRRLTVDMDATPAARTERLNRAVEALKSEPRAKPPVWKPSEIFVPAVDLAAGGGGISFSPDGKRLAVAGAGAGRDTLVVQYDAATWKKKDQVRLFRPAAVSYAGDSERMFVGCNSALGEVRGHRVERFLIGPPELCIDKGSRVPAANPDAGVGNSGSGVLILSPDGKHLLVTEFARSVDRSRSGSVDVRRFEAIVYDSETGEEAKGALPGAGPKGMARFSKDGSLLASYRPGYGEGYPPILEIWNTSRLPWKKIRTVAAANIYPLAAPSFSPDSRYLAGGGHVLEVESGRSVHRTHGPALFDSLGRFLMTWDGNGRGLSFLMVGDWRKFDELMLEQGATRMSFGEVEISADGRTLVGVVNVWQGRHQTRSFTRVYTRGGSPGGSSRPTAVGGL